MPRYSIDEQGNAKIVDERNEVTSVDKLQRVASVFFGITAIACIITYLVFYIDITGNGYAISRIQTRLNSTLCVSSFFQNHLNSKWSTLASKAESIWTSARDTFLAFRQEVR